ncbi:SGNH/GDSL hydrolase family protein [Cohnella soli]|uniref:SGNH/GDSL hydrolase family protein n=1 Tax=Cohnella soli TaxID=425005 RepID=A0ABW0HWL3_9BACL
MTVRTPLIRTLHALREGEVRVGFLGGSITDARPGHNWSDKIMNWLAWQYPNARFIAENAAIGATGSDSGLFRMDNDIIRRNCDLVFVEYAVNDYYVPVEQRKKSREGLIRRLLSRSTCDVVLTYTFLQAMYPEMKAGKVPDSIAEFEELADRYAISSVWMGLHAFEEVQRGALLWEEWLPDGLHPTHRGSLSYAQSVMRFLEQELNRSDVSNFTALPRQLPAPIEADHWEDIDFVPLDEVTTSGHWVVHRSSTIVWIDEMLVTSAVGAKLRFSFEGRGLVLGFDFGTYASEFTYTVDNGEPVRVKRNRESWCVDEGWYRFTLLSDQWARGTHRIEIEVVHGEDVNCRGTRFKLACIGVIK